MANQWFKFYGAEYLSDPKMDRLTVQERSCWLTLLCMASQSEGSIKFLSIEGLLNKSGIHFNPYDSTEWDNTKNVLQNFVQYEMIKIDKNGVIGILNWSKRQEHNLTVAERVAKHRENKKCNKNVTTNVTSVTTEENRIEENRIEENINIYGEFKNVKLSSKELEKLNLRFGEQNTLIIIEELSSYMASKGKRYSNHYATLINWGKRKIETYKNNNKPKRTII
jgi:hypothetical protein